MNKQQLITDLKDLLTEKRIVIDTEWRTVFAKIMDGAYEEEPKGCYEHGLTPSPRCRGCKIDPTIDDQLLHILMGFGDYVFYHDRGYNWKTAKDKIKEVFSNE